MIGLALFWDERIAVRARGMAKACEADVRILRIYPRILGICARKFEYGG